MIEVDEKREEIDLQSGGEILPAGWSQKWIGHATVFVSPDGDIAHTIQQVINAVAIDKSAVVVKPVKKMSNPQMPRKESLRIFLP